ncbi:MAG: xanthine dehydrogenase family protein molybdopterin-binding subunit, partial [Chloroflexi bacterium]|nr:xanthine dehydrogenase family protein molybdopterin-binding subunit [Chloroflexota bacterium]
MSQFSTIGVSAPVREVSAKAKGRIRYGSDLWMPGMLHAAVLRSVHPHARILDIDVEKAKSLPGVVGIYTAQDVPTTKPDGTAIEKPNHFGLLVVDQPFLVEEVIRHVGEPIALVVAATERKAHQAIQLIQVKYEVLPSIHDPVAAMAPDAIKVHLSGNVFDHRKVRFGDAEIGFKEADAVVEEVYSTQLVEHAYIGLEAGLAYFDHTDTLVIEAENQFPFSDREQCARLLGLPATKVRVIHATTGGSFGAKSDLTVQPFIAFATFKTGRPVKMVYTREESFRCSTKRHPFRIRHKIGGTRDGRITALEMEIVADAGAYVNFTPVSMIKSAVHGSGPYEIPNVKVDAIGVFTHNVPSSALRGFGVPQCAFATESQIDVLAYKLGLDPYEVRMRNAVEDGSLTPTGQPLRGVPLKETLRLAAERAEYHRPRPKNHGVGIACMKYGIGIASKADPSTAFVEVDDQGAVKVIVGVVELGQGSDTTMAKIAAETLGLPLENVTVTVADTETTPYAGVAGASRQTLHTGAAVKKAADEARGIILELAASEFGCQPEELNLRDGLVYNVDNPEQAVDILSVMGRRDSGHPVVGVGSFRATAGPIDPETGQGEPYAAWTYATQVAEVEVDPETGEVKVHRIVAAHDVGRAINPQAIEGQVEGSCLMALGQTLMEDLAPRHGHLGAENLAEYAIPTALDSVKIETIIVEEPESTGPFGAKGVAEPATVPVMPAVANAIYDAVGVRITTLPATAKVSRDSQ